MIIFNEMAVHGGETKSRHIGGFAAPLLRIMAEKLAIAANIYHCGEPKSRHVKSSIAGQFDNTGSNFFSIFEQFYHEIKSQFGV